MPSALSTLRTMVTDALGRDDTLAVSLATRGLNFGQLLAAFIFDPEELQDSTALSAGATATTIDLSSVTNFRSIISITNTTGSCPVTPVPWKKWDIIVPVYTCTTQYVKFCARFKDTLRINPPSALNSLTMYFRKLPTALSSPSDELGFDNYDSFILAVAIQFSWACLEEVEAAEAFKTLIEEYTSPLLNGKQISDEINEVLKSGYDF